MNNYPDAMISVSLDRQAEKVTKVQAFGLPERQPIVGRAALVVAVVGVASALLAVLAH